MAIAVSWNGATTAAAWQVLAGAATGPLRPVSAVADRSFETQITVAGAAVRFELRALGSRGQVLGHSAVVGAS